MAAIFAAVELREELELLDPESPVVVVVPPDPSEPVLCEQSP